MVAACAGHGPLSPPMATSRKKEPGAGRREKAPGLGEVLRSPKRWPSRDNSSALLKSNKLLVVDDAQVRRIGGAL